MKTGRDLAPLAAFIVSFIIGALVPWVLPSCHPRAAPSTPQAKSPASADQPPPKTADEAEKRIADLKMQIAGLESEEESLRTAEQAHMIRKWCFGVAAFFGLALIACTVAAFLVTGLRSDLLTGAAACAAIAAAALWGAAHVQLVMFAGGLVVFGGVAWVVWRFHKVHVSSDALLGYADHLQQRLKNVGGAQGLEKVAYEKLGTNLPKLQRRAARLGLCLMPPPPRAPQADPPAGAAKVG